MDLVNQIDADLTSPKKRTNISMWMYNRDYDPAKFGEGILEDNEKDNEEKGKENNKKD